MKDTRDNFDAKTIETLAKRASYICSRPECRALTISPSSVSVDKYLYLGKAAHITSAASKGPRFDPSVTPEQRKSIENGIFLCSSCADMIDKNSGLDFSVEHLREWKSQHEAWVRSNLNKSIASTGGNSNLRPMIDICHRGISVSEVVKEKLYFDIPYCSGKNADAHNVKLEAAVILRTNEGFNCLSEFGDSFPDNVTLTYETGKSINFSLHPISKDHVPRIYIGVQGSYTNADATRTYTVFDTFKFNPITDSWVRLLGEEDKMVRAAFKDDQLRNRS